MDGQAGKLKRPPWATVLAATLRPRPVSCALVVIMWAAMIATGWRIPHELLQTLGVGPASLHAGRWWTPLSSVLFSGHLAAALWGTLLLVSIGSWAEAKLGSLRFTLIGLGSHVVGALLGALTAELLRGPFAGWGRHVGKALDVGPTCFLAGVFMAATAKLDTLWRRRTRVGAVFILGTLFLFSGRIQDINRLIAALIGLAVGAWLFKSAPVRALDGTHREGRVLVALSVAAVSAATILTSLAPGAIGPLAPSGAALREVPFSVDELRSICSDPNVTRQCRHGMYLIRNANIPALIGLLLPQFVQLVLADGLRRGRRSAWLASLVVNLLITALATLNMTQILTHARLYGARLTLGILPNGWPGAKLIVPILVPASLAVLLLAARKSFPVLAPSKTISRLWALIGAALCAGAAFVVVAGMIVRVDFLPDASVISLLSDYLARMLPTALVFSIVPPLVGLTPAAMALTQWPPILVWVVLLAMLRRSFLKTKTNDDSDSRHRMRQLLCSRGQGWASSMGWWSTWQGNSYWFSTKCEAGIAYRAQGGVALSVADPVCALQDLPSVVRDFAGWASTQGLVPAFYSVHGATEKITAQLGWTSLQVAEETLLDLETLEFRGKKFQDVRTAINRAARQAVTTWWTTFPEAPAGVRDQILRICEEWVADKSLPEMGFTLGSLDELNDPQVQLLIASDADHTVQGVTSWLPVYREGVLVGLTLDFMRRRVDGFGPVMELLIAQAAISAKERGLEFISLSGAPLAKARGVATDVSDSTLDAMLAWLSRALEPVYGFRSLLTFKAKFQPRYEPMYLAVPDISTLPSVGLAIGRAYLPETTLRQRLRLGRTLLAVNVMHPAAKNTARVN